MSPEIRLVLFLEHQEGYHHRSLRNTSEASIVEADPSGESPKPDGNTEPSVPRDELGWPGALTGASETQSLQCPERSSGGLGRLQVLLTSITGDSDLSGTEPRLRCSFLPC